MNVTELIKALEYFKENDDGHLQVFFESKEKDEVFVLNAMKIEKSIIPKGIKYLLLGEYDTEKINSPKPQALKEEVSTPKDNSTKMPVADNTTKKKGGIHAKMSEEKTQEILKLIQKGIKYTIIAEIIDCSISHVSRTAKKHGLKEKKVGRPKGKRAGIQKDFEGYNVKCKRCGKGKPSTEYKGTWRVCAECRKRKKEVIK